MRSAQSTEGGISNAVFNPDMYDEQELKVDAFLTDEVTPACSSVRAFEQRCRARRAVADRGNTDQFFAGGVVL